MDKNILGDFEICISVPLMEHNPDNDQLWEKRSFRAQQFLSSRYFVLWLTSIIFFVLFKTFENMTWQRWLKSETKLWTYASQYLPVQCQQWKQNNNAWNLFIVRNKEKLEQCQWRRSVAFIVNVEKIPHIALMSPLLLWASNCLLRFSGISNLILSEVCCDHQPLLTPIHVFLGMEIRLQNYTV